MRQAAASWNCPFTSQLSLENVETAGTSGAAWWYGSLRSWSRGLSCSKAATLRYRSTTLSQQECLEAGLREAAPKQDKTGQYEVPYGHFQHKVCSLKITPEELEFGIFQAARELSKFLTFQTFLERSIMRKTFYIITQNIFKYIIKTLETSFTILIRIRIMYGTLWHSLFYCTENASCNPLTWFCDALIDHNVVWKRLN